ncbi:exported hypothetical protein [Vibrio chagasii]|nr:exported hypothetical protein [Vibrio chagasii]
MQIKTCAKTIAALAVASSLAGCFSDSSSSNNTPLQDVHFGFRVDMDAQPMAAMNSNVSAYEARDTAEYPHFYIVDGYKIKANGEILREDVSLTESFILRVPENANIEVLHPRFYDDEKAGAVDSLTMKGSVDLDENLSYESVTIVMDNHDYSYVTVDHSDHIYSVQLNGTDLFNHETGFDYGYTTTKTGHLLADTKFGLIQGEVDADVGTHYKIRLHSVDGDWDWDINWDEIDIDFGGSVAIHPNRIKNADGVTIHANGNVTGTTKANAQTTASFPMIDRDGNKLELAALKRYSLDLDVEFSDDSTNTYVNIYLVNDNGDTTRGDYHLTGALAGKVELYNFPNQGDWRQFESYSEFVEEFGDWKVRADWNHGNFFNPDFSNFIYRMGDSSYNGVADFIIKSYDVKVSPKQDADSVIPLHNVHRAKDVSADTDTGSVSGMTNGKAVYAHVSGYKSKPLADFEMDFDIEFEGAMHFVNIYVTNEDGENYTVNHYLSGNNEGKFQIQGLTTAMEREEFMGEYGSYTVRINYMESGLNPFYALAGNFVWRSGDSSYEGVDSFVINKYEVK